MTKRLLSTMLGGALLCTTLPAMAAPAPHHAARAHKAESSTDAQTDDLNAQSLRKARAALPASTTATQSSPVAPASAAPVAAGGAGLGGAGRAARHAVQASGTGETAGTIPVPRTPSADGAGY
ncbi:hypothetical protein D3W54_12960 [Komagataeibacter medellinensis]|uniref:Uncharacterized protein n=1 Tax=Komagataeibacter medellinensis TaxID=1177712 RepID=A0ABQ6VXM8_9PROT|nr:hypothetical protein [Komagataeibacter medellinensis]KAB8124954.1 hypothetical protein D3W54_12960 [Komagataeibacter medellinensis]